MNVRHDTRTDDVEYVERKEHRSVAEIVRSIVVLALLVGLVLVALDNRDDVRVGYIFGDASAPIWIVLVASAIAGVVIGWLIKHRPHRNA
jgi:uncharacterized integral membrane protein